jgi:hypothetical protein
VNALSILIGGLIVIMVAVLSFQPDKIDQATEPVNPWETSYPCPIDLPFFNPGALQRSAIGKTLSIALIDQSNRAFHVGMGKVRRVKAITRLGQFLEYLDTMAHGHAHMHATREAAEDAEGNERMVLTAANTKTEQAVRWAYYFNPASYDAYSVVEYLMEDDKSKQAGAMVNFKYPDGRKDSIPESLARSLLFTYYAMTQFPRDKPDGCLSMANANIDLWLLSTQNTLGDKNRVEFWRRTAAQMNQVGYWLDQAESLRRKEIAAGTWQRRSVMALSSYNNHYGLASAVWQQTHQQFEKWQASQP